MGRWGEREKERKGDGAKRKEIKDVCKIYLLFSLIYHKISHSPHLPISPSLILPFFSTKKPAALVRRGGCSFFGKV